MAEQAQPFQVVRFALNTSFDDLAALHKPINLAGVLDPYTEAMK